ncbi:MAG TPA: TIGR01777 family oxidoreductase [Longimicrobiales bacterium]
MRVAITGATGLIGGVLARAFAGDGHEIVVVSRRAAAARRLRTGVEPARVVAWDPARGEIDAAGLEGCDVVIHLAGEPIAGVWTRGKRARIRESRVRGTELLAGALARLERPPAAFLSASGANYYGDRPSDTPMDEDAPPGAGFLAETVVSWEAATRAAETAGIRTVRLRMGVVLTAAGGLLGAVLPLFRLGLGARLGGGEQLVSWIALDDVVAAIRHVLATTSLSGPVNLVAPHAVTNAEFTRLLGRVLGRPTPFAVPAAVLRLLPGRVADELLLAGARVVPRRLEETGFRFTYPELESALRAALGLERRSSVT